MVEGWLYQTLVVFGSSAKHTDEKAMGEDYYESIREAGKQTMGCCVMMRCGMFSESREGPTKCQRQSVKVS